MVAKLEPAYIFKLNSNSLIEKLPEKYGEIWIKMVNIGDLWSRMKRSKTQYNIGADKEII